jgi:hypothetical protein
MSNILAVSDECRKCPGCFSAGAQRNQNNVDNSSTPGYATQTLNLVAQPLVVTGGLTGGVAAQGCRIHATIT